MWHADETYGAEDVSLNKFTDAAGILRMKERGPMRKVLERFEAKFPQLFVSIYLGAFDDLDNIRQFGFWMLNRADYVDLDRDRPNENGILILVDVNSKSASISFGVHRLEGYLLKGWKRVKKDPASLFADTGQQPTHVSDLLQGEAEFELEDEEPSTEVEEPPAEKLEKEMTPQSEEEVVESEVETPKPKSKKSKGKKSKKQQSRAKKVGAKK